MAKTTAGILSEKKRLCHWEISEIDIISEPMVVETGPGRTPYISHKSLKPVTQGPKSLTLKSSAQYFVGRLSPRDRRLLQENLQQLDGKQVTFGSTCSGTDVSVPVIKHTLSELCKIFQVPRLIKLMIRFSPNVYCGVLA